MSDTEFTTAPNSPPTNQANTTNDTNNLRNIQTNMQQMDIGDDNHDLDTGTSTLTSQTLTFPTSLFADHSLFPSQNIAKY